MNNYTEHPRGSEWRKWDLHIHTPYSVLSNNFGTDWDNYVKELFKRAIANDIWAIGITDYFCIDGYKKVKSEYLENPTKMKELFDPTEIEKISTMLILPNVEFRLNKLVGGNRVNFHVLFSNKISTKNIEENFLHELDFIYEANAQSEDEKRKLKWGNLEELGTKLIKEHGDFKHQTPIFTGMMNAVVDDTQICSLLTNKKSIFESNYLIALPSDEDLSDISWNGQDHQTRKILIQKSDILISTNSKTVEWALGRKHNSPDEFIREFKGLKPCIGGSDAHSIEELFTKNENRKVWIKADLTFEGLKQITHEPEQRVKIQALKPDFKNERYVISELQFIDSSKLLGNQRILLNENLNAIIGGKSSGKSLLMFSTAQSIDPEQVDKTSRRLGFEGYKFDSPSPYSFKVTWKNGDIDTLSSVDTINKLHKITYIPQLYINHLVEKNNKEELNGLIKNILLQDSYFRDFFEDTTTSITETTSEIEGLLNEYIKVRNKGLEVQKKSIEVGNSDNIKKAIAKYTTEILQGQKASNLTEKEFDEYNKLLGEKSVNDLELRSINKKISTLIKIVSEVKNSKSNLLGKSKTEVNSNVYLTGQVDRIINELGELPEDVLTIKRKITADFDLLIANLENEINKLDLTLKRNNLYQKIRLNTERLEPFIKKLTGQKELQKLTAELESEKIKLQNALALESQLNNLIKEYFNIRKETARLLKSRFELYQQIVQKVNDTKKYIASDIELTSSLIYRLSNFALNVQVNKAALSMEHFYNSLHENGLVNYNLVPEFYEKVLKVLDDQLIYGDDENIPLRVRVILPRFS